MEATISHDEDDGSSRTQPKLADPRAWQFVSLRLAGKSLGECSAELNIPPRTLWTLRQEYDLDELVEQLHADVLDSLKRERGEVAQLALRRIKALLLSEKPAHWKWAIDRALGIEGQPVTPGPAKRSATVEAPSRDELVRRARAAATKRLGK